MSYRDIVRAQLRVDEGTVEYAYQDSEGYWTIGVGRLIDKRLGGRLRPEEIAMMLENDITQAEEDAKALFPGFESLVDARKAVLVNLAFNMGRNRLATFQRLRRAVSEGDWEWAAAEMLDSRWSEQVGQRAVRLAEQMKKGE